MLAVRVLDGGSSLSTSVYKASSSGRPNNHLRRSTTNLPPTGFLSRDFDFCGRRVALDNGCDIFAKQLRYSSRSVATPDVTVLGMWGCEVKERGKDSAILVAHIADRKRQRQRRLPEVKEIIFRYTPLISEVLGNEPAP